MCNECNHDHSLDRAAVWGYRISLGAILFLMIVIAIGMAYTAS